VSRPEQELERSWWGTAGNTFHEEQKQLVYAPRMGLVANWETGHPPEFDLTGRSVADIGGGPSSLLLKTVNAGRRLVIDPCEFPAWVYLRYAECGIDCWTEPGETWEPGEEPFDEGWVYNVMQHVEDPERFIYNVRRNVRLIRLFEWIDIPAYDGHPHTLTEPDFYHWLGGGGLVEEVNESGAVGRAFYGVFAVS
jgi:hypothetical protein